MSIFLPLEEKTFRYAGGKTSARGFREAVTFAVDGQGTLLAYLLVDHKEFVCKRPLNKLFLQWYFLIYLIQFA